MGVNIFEPVRLLEQRMWVRRFERDIYVGVVKSELAHGR